MADVVAVVESVTVTVSETGPKARLPPKGTGLLAAVPEARTATGLTRGLTVVPSPS